MAIMSRPGRRRLAGLAVPLLITLLTAPVAVSASAAPSPPDALLTCATAPLAMLTSADLGAFTQFGDAYGDNLGLTGLSLHPIDTAFLGGRWGMWVATMALSGRYRADNDAYARSLGYPIHDLPLLPPVGLIVTEHPAEPLAVYERVLVFRDAAWAAQWLAMTRADVARQATMTENGVVQPAMALAPVSLGDEAVAQVQPPTVGGRVPSSATIMVETRVGRTDVGVTINGGAGLEVGQVEAVAREALAQVEGACAGQSGP